MKLARRLVRVCENLGPLKRNVLRGLALAKHPGEDFETVFNDLLRDGALVMYGERKGAKYGIPRRKQ